MTEASILSTPGSGTLHGRIALVTGASSGIGRAIAVALHGVGCKVIITGRNLKALEELAHGLGPEIHPLRLDMNDAAGIAALPASLPKAFAAPDILINNAAEDVGGRTRFDTLPAEDLVRVIETNLLGVVRITRALVPAMLENGRGDIVNIGSTNALRPTPNMAVYTASKTGVHGLTDVLRADYSKVDLRVMEIVPGLTRTGFAQTRMKGNIEKAEAFFEQFPSTLKPEDVAEPVLYALSRPRHVCIQQIVVTPSFQW